MTVVQGQEVIERSGQRVVVVDAIDVELCDPDWQPGAGDDVKPMLGDIFFINNYACQYPPPSIQPREPDFRDFSFSIKLRRGILDLAPLTVADTT